MANVLLSKTEVRPNKPRDGRHCDLCGCSQPAVRCDKCGCQIFCLSCDDMYHRHPKRRFHLRKAVDPTPPPQARPVLPMKVSHLPTSPGDPSKMPLPPPRKKKPGKSFFDTFRRRSPPPQDNSPPLPKKEYSWTDRLGNIKKFMSNRPLPPLPTANGSEENEQNSQPSKLSFIHKRVDVKPPQLPQRSLKPNEFSREKENIPGRLHENTNDTMRNGTFEPSQMNRNRGFSSEEESWENRRMGNPQMNTLNRQNQQGFFPQGGPGFPGNRTNTMQHSSSVTDLQNMNMEGYPGQAMIPPHYPPHYPMNPHMPHFPYPVYHPQYPNYPQYFGNSFANLASQPNTTDGDFSDQSEASSRHHHGRKYQFRKRAKRSQSVMVDRMAFPGQFYPFGPFPPGYGPGPWGQPCPMEAPPSPAGSVRSLNRVARTRRRKKMTSDDDDEELSGSSSPLSRPKSSSSERPPPAQRLAPLATQTTSEEESDDEKERSRSRNERQSRRDSDPNRQKRDPDQRNQTNRRDSDPRKVQSPIPKSPQVHHKKIPKQKQRGTVKESDSEELPSSPVKVDRQSSRESNIDTPEQDRNAPPYTPSNPWQCRHCTFINPPGNRICQVCCKTATVAEVAASTPSRSSSTAASSRKQSFSSEPSCSSPEKKMEVDDTTESKRNHQDMDVLNTALDEAEKEISRGLEELMKLKEESATDSDRTKHKETSAKTEENASQTKPVYKSSGKMRTSILDKLNLQSGKEPGKSTTTSTDTQTGPSSKTDRIIEARRPSTSSNASDQYNSPMAQSPELGRAASGQQNNASRSRKESSCQTQPDDLLDYLERKRAEEEAYFGRSAFRYGERMDTITSPVPAMYDRGFGGGFGVMHRSHSRASLFTGRLNDLGPVDYMGPTPMYRSVSRSSLTGDFTENRLSDFHNLRKPDYYLSMEELVERRRQESIRAQGLELVRMIREAEQQGFTADDIQVALSNCGNQNPLEWLHENWRNMVENVIALCTSYAHDKKENDIGTVSENEAREALRMHKGNVWAAVTECVESRQRKFLELKARGKFSTKDITDILTSSQGDVEMAYAKLTKSTSRPFLMRIWGAGEGVPNQDGAMPMTNGSFASPSDRFHRQNADKEDVLSDELWDDDDEEDVEWEEDSEDDDEPDESEALQTCRDDGCVSDEIRTPVSDKSDYCDAFGANTLERNISSPGSDTFFVIPDVKPERKGTSFLSKLAALRKEDKGSKKTQSKFYDKDQEPRFPDLQRAKEDSNQDVSDQTKPHGALSVIKNTISAIRDSVSGSKSEKKLPCSAPERRTIIVKGQIEHESLSNDSNKVKLTSVKPIQEDVLVEERIENQKSMAEIKPSSSEPSGSKVSRDAKISVASTTNENSEDKLPTSKKILIEAKGGRGTSTQVAIESNATPSSDSAKTIKTGSTKGVESSPKKNTVEGPEDKVTTLRNLDKATEETLSNKIKDQNLHRPSEKITAASSKEGTAKLDASSSSVNKQNDDKIPQIYSTKKDKSSLSNRSESPRYEKEKAPSLYGSEKGEKDPGLQNNATNVANVVSNQKEPKETTITNKPQQQATALLPPEVSSSIDKDSPSGLVVSDLNVKREKEPESNTQTKNKEHGNNKLSQISNGSVAQAKLNQDVSKKIMKSTDQLDVKVNANESTDVLNLKSSNDLKSTSHNTKQAENDVKNTSPTNATNRSKLSESHSNQSPPELLTDNASDALQESPKIETNINPASKSIQDNAFKKPSSESVQGTSINIKYQLNSKSGIAPGQVKSKEVLENIQDGAQGRDELENKLEKTTNHIDEKIDKHDDPSQSETKQGLKPNVNEPMLPLKDEKENVEDEITEHEPVKATVKETKSRPSKGMDIVPDLVSRSLNGTANSQISEELLASYEDKRQSPNLKSKDISIPSTSSEVPIKTDEETVSEQSSKSMRTYDELSVPDPSERLNTSSPESVADNAKDATASNDTQPVSASTTDPNIDAKPIASTMKQENVRNEIPSIENASKVESVKEAFPTPEELARADVIEVNSASVSKNAPLQNKTVDSTPESPTTSTKPKKKIIKKSKKEESSNISGTYSSLQTIKEINDVPESGNSAKPNNAGYDAVLEKTTELPNEAKNSDSTLEEPSTVALLSSNFPQNISTVSVQSAEITPAPINEREQSQTKPSGSFTESSEAIIRPDVRRSEITTVTTDDPSESTELDDELTHPLHENSSLAVEQNTIPPDAPTVTNPAPTSEATASSESKISSEAGNISSDTPMLPESDEISQSVSNLHAMPNQPLEASADSDSLDSQQHSKDSISHEEGIALDSIKLPPLSDESSNSDEDDFENSPLTSERIITISDREASESEEEEIEFASVSSSRRSSMTAPNPIDALRSRFEGLIDANSTGTIRPQSPYRRMSFRSRKAAIALERTRDTSLEKPWFMEKPKPPIEPIKPLTKRSLKQQLDIERRVRKMVSDRKCRTYRKAEIVVQLVDMNFEEDEAIQAANDCSTLEQAISYLQQECQLCTGCFPVSNIISMVHCSHKACRQCLRAYFTVQIRDRNIMELLCPFCNEPDIFDEDIAQDYFNHLDIMLKKLVDPEIHELFQRKLRDRVLMRDENFKWCSQCSSGFIAMPNLKRLVCPDCNAVSCASCRRPWEKEHQGISCEAFATWKDAGDPEAQTVGLAKLLTEDGIDCPRCHFRYALAKGGCMHFRCIQCQHDFCSGCSKPFKMGQKCGVSEFCAKLGLHAHHPRNCLFYLRDKDPEDLQRLLDLSNIKYDRDLPDGSAEKGACQVLEQKETADGMVDDFCGKEVEDGFAGLCRIHYVEYLGQLVNKHKVDPIQIFENDDLELVLRRANIRLPPKRYRETDEKYREKLVNLIQEELSLDKVEGS